MPGLSRSPLAIALLLGVPLALAVAAVPGLRHRHDGVESHHADGSDDRGGWHVHLSLFGFEVTVWEPPAEEAFERERLDPAAPQDDRRDEGDGGPTFVVSSPLTAGWVSLFWIDSGPVPARVLLGEADPAASFPLPANDRPAPRTDAPSVPPPEAV